MRAGASGWSGISSGRGGRIERRRAAVPAVSYPPELPVSARRDDLLAAIRDHQVVVVAGETGSGKTTQLPKFCLELGRGIRGTIGHTQPRRLAARTVAERIADELGTPLGEAVGYAVRFTDRSARTRCVRLMTDGLLLAEIQPDRLLRRYDTIIVDEAHERSLNIDFLLGYLHADPAAAARPEADHHLAPRSTPSASPRTSATRRSSRCPGAPIPVEVRYRPPPSRGRRRPGRRDRRRGRGAAARGRGRHAGVPVRRARDPRHRRRARAAGCATDVEVLPLYARLSAPSSSASSGRTAGGASCWPPTSPRRR